MEGGRGDEWQEGRWMDEWGDVEEERKEGGGEREPAREEEPF